MTYPPQPGQPPYGHQPGPYDQGGFPQSGGFPQQGGQYPPTAGYPRHDPYGQYGGSYGDQYGGQYGWHGQQDPYGQYGGQFGQQPPGRKKTGLWIGLSAAAVAVAAFLVTGLAAPGFLLGDDDTSGADAGGTGRDSGPVAAPSAGDGPGTAPSTPRYPGTDASPGGDSDSAPGTGGEAEQLAGQVTDALNSGAGDTVTGLFCDGMFSLSEEHVATAVNGSAELTVAPSGGPRETGGVTSHLFQVSGTLDGTGTSGLLAVAELRGDLCVSTFTLF